MSTIAPENTKIVQTICQAQNCYVGCGIRVHVADGRIVKIEGDEKHPRNDGAVCVKGTTYPEVHNHPDRLLYPLQKRDGEFVRIGWDEALDETAGQLGRIIKESGPEAAAIVIDGLSLQISTILLARSFGNPNVMDIIDYCEGPSVIADCVTVGEPITQYASEVRTCIEPGVTDCVVFWGCNPFVTNLHIREKALQSVEQGAKLIVIDPVCTTSAKQADTWVQIRPGTDVALALGMINVIIEESAYDTEFVQNWCHGFEEFRARASEYPLDRVAQITDVPAETIREIALTYANAKAAYIHSRLGLMQQRNATQTARAMTCLIALTGNIEKPGTHLLSRDHGILTLAEMIMGEDWRLDDAVEATMFGRQTYPLHSEYNFLSHNPSMLQAMIDGKIRAAFVAGVNPLAAFPDARRVREAFAKLDFLVVVDMFENATTEMADIVLPTTNFLERKEIANDEVTRYVSARNRVVAPRGECRDDYDIARDIAERMGIHERYFRWANREALDDYRLGKIGLSVSELGEVELRELPIKHGLHREDGFATPSGKIELYSTVFKQHGHDPLPYYEAEPDDFDAEAFPFVFVTRRDVHFQNSSGRQAKSLQRHIDPLVEVHPDLAERKGISDGQWVTIKTPFGQIKQKAKFNAKMRNDVVAGLSGAWSPAASHEEERVFAHNVNVLTSQTERCDPISGVPEMKNIRCDIYPAN
jgi:thiosulfate reductase/polysulfide reductase chain A